MITISDYHVDVQIYESNNSCVYRGRRERDNLPVILKVLPGEYPTPLQLSHYQQEYEITRSLKLSGVVQAYSLEKMAHTTLLIMEDFGGQSLAQLGLAGQLTVTEFLDMAITLSEILGQVHQAGVMHKDINPTNIVLNPTTGQLKLIDFGLASRLTREYTMFRSPHKLAGTLPYISPEQTGRMNRVVDYRSDLYSLGITFYELLIGQLPFLESDPLALVHAHIAQTPTPPHYFRASIPPILSEIILKLLAKNAEERYQSAFGLQHDLKQIQANLPALSDFTLGQYDQSGRFQLPQQLYGRQAELAQLTEIVARVATGARELVLVGGDSGVGKSALVQEMYQQITTQGGQFLVGKFDQYQHDQPYSALIQAFHGWVNDLLTLNPPALAAWQSRLLQSVGNNGQVLLEIIPSLEQLIGPLPPLPELGPLESQNRFHYTVQQFIQAIATAEHPLILFLDDLQWADKASLQVLQRLLTDLEIHHGLIIGVYRHNEVDSSHPLMTLAQELQQQAVNVTPIILKNLELAEVQTLTANTLNCPETAVTALAELIYAKTQGNAFFVRQFLQSLYDQELIKFNYELQVWQWDMPKISRQTMTANVVALLVTKMRKLSAEAQEGLKVAACIGHSFDLLTLALVHQVSQSIMLQHLWVAIEQGLIILLNENYQRDSDDEIVHFMFAHDRVQQAAYSLIEPEQQAQLHWQIGQILWTHTPPERVIEKVFDIVNQINLGKQFVANPEAVAELNLWAGRKAKEATAYQSAADYLAVGLALLPETAWQTHYPLMFELHHLQGQVKFLLGDHDQADYWLDLALRQAKTQTDKVRLYLVKITQLTALGRYGEALHLATEVLHFLGLPLPWPNQAEQIEQATAAEVAIYQQTMAGRQIEDLAHLPDMTDETMLLCVTTIALTVDTLTIAFPQLLPLYTYKAVNIALKHGLSPDMPLNFVFMAFTQALMWQEFEVAYKFTLLGEILHDTRYSNLKVRSKIYHNRALYSVLGEHLEVGLRYFRKGQFASLEMGDLAYATYNILGITRFLLPLSLETMLEEAHQAIPFLTQTQNVPILWLVKLLMGVAYSLQGQTFIKTGLDYEGFTVAEYERLLGEAPTVMAYLRRSQLQNLAIWGSYEEALPFVHERVNQLKVNPDCLVWSDYNFYSGLVVVALYAQADEPTQAHYQAILSDCLAKLATFAGLCAANFAHPYLILQAEEARLAGRVAEAMQFYNQGIESAKAHGFWQHQAIGNELAGKFYLAQGIKTVAGLYLREADYAYQRWGATAKAKALRAQYREFFLTASTSYAIKSSVTSGVTSSWEEEQLDFAAIVKASQAISQEIDITKLLTTLLRLVLENAGAQKAGLVLEQEGALQVMAVATGYQPITLYQPPQTLAANQEIPINIVQYVAHTQLPLVLDEASQQGHFVKDEYVLQHRPQSILCLPLMQQGQLKGVLYLENNLAHHAFTSERVKVSDLLGTQAVISISNMQVIAAQAEQARLELQKEVIYNTTNLLSASTHLPDLLQSVTHGVAAALPAYAVSLIICDMPQQKVTQFVIGGAGSQAIEFVSYEELQDGLTGWVLRERQPALSVKGVRDTRESLEAHQRRVKQGIGSIMVVPIHYGETILGTMTALNRLEARDFKPKDVELMLALANQVAVAIKQATLYRELADSERKYRTLFEDSRDLIFITTVEGQILEMNSVCEALLGYTRTEILQMNILQLYAYPSSRYQLQQEIVARGAIKDFEHILKRKDGTFVNTLFTATMRKDKDGRVIGYQGIMRDVTAQKAAAEALKRSEAEYRQLVEQANSIILKWDMAGKITFINEFGLRFFGYTEIELLGQPMIGTIAPQTERTGRDLARLLADIPLNPDLYRRNENENITKDGRQVWIIWSNQLIRNEQGEPIGVLSIGNDNTARREAEELLKQYNQRLEEQTLNRAIELQRRMNELTVLNQITQIVSVVTDTETMWQAVAQEINHLFQNQSCALSFFNPAKTELNVVSVITNNGQPSPAVGVLLPMILTNDLVHQLVYLGQAIVISDPQTNPIFAPVQTLLQMRQIQAVLVAPLLTHGEVIGTIALFLDQVGREFVPTEISLLETIAGQVATAIENNRLFAAEQHQRHLAEALREVAQVLNSTLNQEQVLTKIFEQLGRVILYDSGAVFLREGEELVLFKSSYLMDKWLGRRIPLASENVTVKVFHEQHHHIVGDVRQDPTWLIWADTAEVRSWMGVPLLVGEEATGVLTVDSLQVNAYSEADAQTLQMFANQAAIAIHNARRAEDVEEALHETQLLYRVGNLLTKSVEPQIGVEKAVGECLWAVGLGQGSLTLFNDDRTSGVLYVSYYDDEPETLDLLLQPIYQCHRQIVQEGRPVTIYDALENPLLADRYDDLRRRGIKSLLMMPLLARGQVTGVLEVAEIAEERAFETREINLVKMVADQIAASIEQYLLVSQAEEARALAEKANQAKSIFLARMSHELRTPLNAVLGFSQLMQRDAHVTAEQAAHLEIINRNGENLLLLINDVLEMSKIEAGQIMLLEIDFDLSRLLEDIQLMFQLPIKEKGLTLRIEQEANVPRYIHADQIRLRQVLVNLLNNALKFTLQGGIYLRVRQKTENLPTKRREKSSPFASDPSYFSLHFEVEDTGFGIAEEEQPRLFDPFVQTESGRQSQQGTGLGLSISRGFVRLMGGNLEVKSQLGHGSCFSFDILARPAQESASTVSEPLREVVGLRPGQREYRLLVAEDKLENRQVLTGLLTSVGLVVREAVNGVEAVALWESWQPDLIFMDIQMPLMDGYEATRQIRAHPLGEKCIIIAITASAFEEERAMILAVGCNDVVLKPFQFHMVWAQLARHLGLEYIYADELEASGYVSHTETRLSAELVSALEAEAVAGNISKLIELVEQVRPLNGPLAMLLAHCVDNFDYEKILTLLAEVK